MYWLKLLWITFKALQGLAPKYMGELFPGHLLRSENATLLDFLKSQILTRLCKFLPLNRVRLEFHQSSPLKTSSFFFLTHQDRGMLTMASLLLPPTFFKCLGTEETSFWSLKREMASHYFLVLDFISSSGDYREARKELKSDRMSFQTRKKRTYSIWNLSLRHFKNSLQTNKKDFVLYLCLRSF